MSSEIIKSLMFGLGIMIQVIILLDYKFKKNDLKEILKDIGGGFLFIFYIMFVFSESVERGEEIDSNSVIISSIYAFCLGFGAAFALSFKKRILLKISEINLLVLNLIFLYYCITQLGFDNWFTKIIYLPTLITFVLVLFRNKLKNTHKGFLYLWYIALFMIIGTINIYQILGSGGNAYSSYLSSFFIGGIFLYIWIYFVCLVIFIHIIDYFGDKDRPDVRRGRLELKEHFWDLANSFNETKISNLKILMLFIASLIFLIANYYNNYISENLLIALILFISSVLSVKRIDLAKKDITKEH